MGINIGKFIIIGTILCGLSACGMTKPNNNYKMQSYIQKTNLSAIEPAAGGLDTIAIGNNDSTKESCSFSSFHRKNAIGYEWDESTHIGFDVSPKIDVFNPSNAEVEFGLNFTMALGGAANKRPKCTYGSGYYGFLPYAMNDKIEASGLMNKNNIKSFVREKIKIREERQKAREKKSKLRI